MSALRGQRGGCRRYTPEKSVNLRALRLLLRRKGRGAGPIRRSLNYSISNNSFELQGGIRPVQPKLAVHGTTLAEFRG